MHKSSLSQEDPLTYLPRKPIQEFAKGAAIYDPERPNDRLYVTILGRVKVSNLAEDGCQTVGRIVSVEGVFGESCLVGTTGRAETAIALDNATLMSWSRSEIETQIEREPALGVALTQHFARECVELQDRIENMAVYKTPERVMLALIQLANDLGVPTPDGAMRVASLTHHNIAEYVGTSREIVTFQMNRLRRLGMLRYSRKFIDIFIPPLHDALRARGIGVRGILEERQTAGG